MTLVAQWERIQSGLPTDWADARLALSLSDEAGAGRAAALLGPLAPGRLGDELRFSAARHGGGPSPGAAARALARLDAEGIGGELSLLGSGATVAAETARPEASLAESWDGALAELPPDWSDLYVELELTSSDHLDPAALALAPVNPSRHGEQAGFRFRCARQFGYGASPGMVRRCLERLDGQSIPGELRILRVLSGTKPVGTQGPVWYVGGKVV